MPRKRRVAVIAVSLSLALGAVLAWFLWLPSLIRGQIEEAARRRGLTASVGGVQIGLFGVDLTAVELEAGRGALRVEIGRVEVDASVAALAISGSGAVEAVEVRDVRVGVQLDSPQLSRVLRRLRGDATGGGSTDRSGRRAAARNVEIVLRDRRGALFRSRGGEIALSSNGRLRVTTGSVELGAGEPDGAQVDQLAARLERGSDGWKIAEASASGVDIRYRDRAEGEQSPLWERIRGHVRRVSDDPSTGTGGASSGGAPLIDRVRRAIGPRLARGAVLRLDALSVRTGSGTAGRTVLRDLDAEIRSLEGGRFDLRGAGHPGGGGRLGWRLVVDPDELRAEGNVDFQRVPFVLLVPVLPRLPWYRPEEARVSGELEIRGRGATRVHMAGDVRIDDLGFSSRRFAPNPVRAISMSFSGEADWDPTSRRLDVRRAEFGVGDARAHLSGSFEWPEDHYLVDVRATLPPTDCNVALGAVPADLLSELTALTFDGEIGGSVRARIDSRDLDATVFDVQVADGCVFQTVPAIADVRRFEAPFSHRVVEPDGSIFEMETGPGTANWTELRDISPHLVQAVVAHEDGAFFAHRGFHVPSIRLALVRNLAAGRYAHGASTITMQLVKNVFLHREKTLARKVQEVLLTWWIESVMPKERILELYLNVIEYGPSVYGIRAAAEHYFGRTPAELGPAESAYLACILPSPKLFHEHWVAGELPERFRGRVERFLRTLGSRGRYDRPSMEQGLEELRPLRFARPGQRLEPTPLRGRAAPLPVGEAVEEQWEEAIGPDDPGAEEEGWQE
jgi:hypothetical protein